MRWRKRGPKLRRVTSALDPPARVESAKKMAAA
jgi:hypothetical protein